MIKNYLEKIRVNIYGQDSTNKGATIKEIEACEKRLSLSLPIPLKELYEVFGKDKKILNAYHSFLSLENLQVIDGVIIFYELIDKYSRYGTLVEDVSKDDPKVKLQRENDSSWYFEARNLSEYILNNIFWHGVNLMKLKSKIKMKEENLEKNLQDILYKISDERKLSRGIKYSYYNKEESVMTTYSHYQQLLILGSNDKSKLQEVENNVKASLGCIERKLTSRHVFNQSKLTKFIVNSVVFQTINSFGANAILNDSEITLEEYFTPLYDVEEKDNKRISYISNDGCILALHFIDENVVYFGAAEDKTLNEFEEKAEIDLDWL